MTSDYEVYHPPNPYYFLHMKKQIQPLLLLVIALLISGCFRNDIRTVTFHIDQMRNLQAAEQIAQSLRVINGIQDFQPNLEERTLTIVFNGRELYLKNIEYAIVKAGFSLPHWPADATDIAKLPKELQ